ncbi:hypothetical protein K3495_g685 [Podosphaera aphanis]|nr:hypothetical protein K3495_g685 [Podosphaera aphanis]
MASSKTSRTVCVIGAGPSGLVAAKTLAHSAQVSLNVTVFEAKSRIGGLWPSQSSDTNGPLSPYMRTNLSRHTVAFSDSAWDEKVPTFPYAWQVGAYLEKYRKLYPNYDIEFNKKVIAVRRDAKDAESWCVKVLGEEVERKFDYVVIATGFFGEPKLNKNLRKTKVPVWHSSQIREIGKGDQKIERGKHIVVAGGQMSGVEIAATLAFQISNDNCRPDGSLFENSENLSVIHVVKKPVWVMPLVLPQNPMKERIRADKTTIMADNAAPNFLPLDLVMNDLNLRPPGPVVSNSGHISEKTAEAVHNKLEKYIGNSQNDLNVTSIAMKGHVRSEPPYVSISDSYSEFVRQGKIKVIQGQLISASEELNEARINDKLGNSRKIEDVAAIVCATGFDAAASLSFLSEEILQTLHFDPGNCNFPLVLNVHSTVSRSMPKLGFIGFYRGPYWGVMEMQARYLAKLWAGDETAKQALDTDQTAEAVVKLRADPRVAQFPMGDYVYLMEYFANVLQIQRSTPDYLRSTLNQMNIVVPHRYLCPTATALQKSEAAKSLALIARDIIGASSANRFLSRAVFRGLQGIWCLKRFITSQIDSFPSGTLDGTAVFHPRYLTLPDLVDGSGTADPESSSIAEYLYAEEGDFTLSWGGRMRANRSYVWRYDGVKDSIEVWFTKDHKTPDYFFHALIFDPPSSATEDPSSSSSEHASWRATSTHLCINDLYRVTYTFSFRGAALQSWSSTYTVHGPKKDYKIENTFARPEFGCVE